MAQVARRKIPASVKRLIAALRSGDYKQVRGRLGTEKEGFCVLGLLGHLLYPNDRRSAFNNIGTLSNKAVEKLKNGVRWDSEGRLSLRGKEVCPSLMTLNDNGYTTKEPDGSTYVYDPYTFEELADCIEWVYLYS